MNNHQIATAIVFTAIVLYEVLLPFKAYVGRLKHYGRNVTFSLINSLITGFTSAALGVYAFALIKEHHLGLLGQLPFSPMIITIFALLLSDLWIYSWHRMNHQMSFLWRFHQVHHNDTQMDSSTALRFHPGEIFFSSIFETIFFVIAGLQIEQVILYKTILRINIFIHHSNITIAENLDKTLRWIIVTPNTHRVHHSIKREETDSNFSSVLTIWDRIFGTYRESDPTKIIYGLETDRDERGQSLMNLLVVPFRVIRKITATQLKQCLHEPGTIILDVRKEKDFAAAHIPGAVSMHEDQLPEFIRQTEPSRKIICYCYKGISSRRYCQKLTQAGFQKVFNLRGGYAAWDNKGTQAKRQ